MFWILERITSEQVAEKPQVSIQLAFIIILYTLYNIIHADLMLSEISEYIDGLLDTDETTPNSSNEQGKSTSANLPST